jgi:hypothetical protein
VRADGVIDRPTAQAALTVYDVDELGLDRLDRAVLDALVRRFGGGPVGVATLAVAVGEEQRTVEEVAEPYLVRAGCWPHAPRPGGHSGRLDPSRYGSARTRHSAVCSSRFESHGTGIGRDTLRQAANNAVYRLPRLPTDLSPGAGRS